MVHRSGGSVYLLLNKPRGVVTTLRDPEGRKTVADLIREAGFRQRLFPVGRLDFDAEGLLLVTNDGEMAHAVLHPSRGLPKLYLVKVRGQPDRKALSRLRGGISLEKGVRTRPAKVEIARPGDNPWLQITLKEGRPNQIKRMLCVLEEPAFRQVAMHVVQSLVLATMLDVYAGIARNPAGNEREIETIRLLGDMCRNVVPWIGHLQDTLLAALDDLES